MDGDGAGAFLWLWGGPTAPAPHALPTLTADR